MAAMSRIFLGLSVAAVSGLLGTVAVSKDLEEVTVIGARTVASEKLVSHPQGGPTIKEISISYEVGYGGLDLASSTGATELRKRVQEAANAACKDIGEQRPLLDLTPDVAECARSDVARAMVKVHELVAAAEKKRAK